MTIQEIRESREPFLLAKDITDIMGSDINTIRWSAKEGTLGFPVCFCGNRLKIPRIPFLRFLGEDA